MIRGNLLEIPTSDELQSSKKVIPQSEYCFREKKLTSKGALKRLKMLGNNRQELNPSFGINDSFELASYRFK